MKVDLRSPHSIIDKFVSLLSISHRINSEKDFDELLHLITAEAAKLVDAERATIFLLDKATGQLWAKTAIGLSETIRFDARLGIAGAVLISGKNMIVEDAYKSPLFNPSIDSLTGFQTRNILSVPLRNIRREIIGVFQVQFYSTTNVMIQVLVPARLRGRVLSLYLLTSIGFIPVANLVGGAIAEVAGVEMVLAAGGALTVCIAVLVAVLEPDILRLRAAHLSLQESPEAA